MEVEDIDRFARTLNTTTQTIKEATETVETNPAQAMGFVPKIMDHLKEIHAFGDVTDISASISDDQKNVLHTAISQFLQNTKEAQEKVGTLGASIFGNPQVVSLTANLEQVKSQLERGKRVEAPEKGEGI